MTSKAPYLLAAILACFMGFRFLPWTLQVNIVLVGRGALVALLFGVVVTMGLMAGVQSLRK